MTTFTSNLVLSLLFTLTFSFAIQAKEDNIYLDQVNPTSARGQAKVIEADEGGYADILTSGDTVYLSGWVAGLRPGETDLDVAYDRAFKGMGETLARVGLGWDDVVEMVSYHTDIKSQIDSYSRVRRRYVKPPFPTSTVIQVVRLIPDRGLTEIKITAKRPK